MKKPWLGIFHNCTSVHLLCFLPLLVEGSSIPWSLGMQGDGAPDQEGFQLPGSVSHQEMEEGTLWDKSLQRCHTYGQAKLVWRGTAQTSCETKISTVQKSGTFLSRALEGVENYTWTSNCRFFFCSFFSSPSHNSYYKWARVLLNGRRGKDQTCTVASFWYCYKMCP